MIALHNSPITAHGNLKSSKCLIDSRWVCKVSDFGLDSVKANQTREDHGEYAKYRGKKQVFITPHLSHSNVKKLNGVVELLGAKTKPILVCFASFQFVLVTAHQFFVLS